MKKIGFILFSVLIISIWQGIIFNNSRQTANCEAMCLAAKTAYTPSDPRFGIGLVDVTQIAGSTKGIPIYLSRKCNIPVDTLRFSYPNGNDLAFHPSFKYGRLTHCFKPYQQTTGNKNGLGLTPNPKLIFRVLAVHNNIFEILLDELKQQTAFIKIDSDCNVFINHTDYVQNSGDAVLFETWKMYLKRANNVILTDADMYNNIDGHRLTENVINTRCKVNKVTDNWAEVVTCDEKQYPIKGWVRWVSDNQLLLSVVD